MMEGMTLSNQEGYIWAMRVNAYRESDSEVWKDRISESSVLPSLKSGRSDKKSKNESATMCLDNTMKALVTLVPDEIIFNPADYDPKTFEACFLYFQFLGFTDLSEKYIHIGKGGPSRLTKVLNSYIGTMIQELLSHNGDVLKFSANSFLVMWKCHYGQPMQDCVHQAIDCAVLVQKNHACILTDIGSTLSVTMTISAGETVFALLGNEDTAHQMVLGQAIWDVKRKTDENRNPGDVIVSPNAWHFINPSEYLYEYQNDGLHVKVMGVGPNWRSTQKSQTARDRRHPRHRDAFEEKAEEIEGESSSSDDDFDENDTAEEFVLRPVMNIPSLIKYKRDLRRFVLGPVLRGIDMDEPLEYLTEIRKLVILCCNVQFRSMPVKDSVELINKMYGVVYSLVEPKKGCINEVQGFENNVTFKVIFGLRGYKQNLESQVGLLCAKRIYDQLNSVGDPIVCLSIGITTGMSYCGVVGHSLRREYLVISTIARKALGIMQAYPIKITCDRETYIHSKLETSCFELQEAIFIPEVTNTGPIYAYIDENANKWKESDRVNYYPVLGRDAELAFYIFLLNRFLQMAKERVRGVIDRDVPDYKCTYMIEGPIRSGKTRLLEEMIYYSPDEVPVARVRFDSLIRGVKVPYLGIKKILYPFLSFTDTTTVSQKEQALMKRLSKMKVPELLCSLNEIFNVNFRVTTLYMSLGEEKRILVQKKMIKQLFFGCFPEPWLITVDNACMMDDKSWIFLEEVLNLDIIFLLLSLNSEVIRTESTPINTIKNHKRVFTLTLDPIEAWYQLGIACQILGVHAIPIELERVIQEECAGNPGYIESFLISLVQAGGIVYREVSKSFITELGLVEPPPEMLNRAFDWHKYEKLMVIVNNLDGKSKFRKRAGVVEWKMFHHCFKKETYIENEVLNDKPVSVIFLTSTFELCQVSGEFATDVLTLKTIDNLSFFERNILKCGSVLGDMFTRLMLYYVMNITDIPRTARAIRKLFEMRILACAQGDFTPGEDNTMDCFLIFKNRFYPPDNNGKVQCHCKGIALPECLQGYPKYSYCGYMRFVLPSFREITNSLLIDKQRRELNTKAVRYLEKEIRRCRPCGGGFFVKFMGKRYDDGLKSMAKRMKRAGSKTSSTNSTTTNATNAPNSTSSRPSSANVDIRHLKSSDAVSMSYDGRGNRRYPSDCFIMSKCTHPAKILKMRAKYSITRTFSSSDFSGCYCSQILDTMYTRMLRHAYESDLSDKIIDAMLEYSYVCIVTRNIPLAIIILNDAYILLDDEKVKAAQEEDWKIRLLRAKIKCLQGYSRHQFGQPEEAYKLFHQAMKYFGCPFPSTNGAMHWMAKYREFLQNIALFYIPKFLQKSMRDYQIEYCENLAECLGYMYDLFRERQLWLPAQLAATWALNRALMSNVDFYRLAIAYSDMLEIELHNGNHRKCIILEVHALQLCHRKKTSIEDCELRAVTKMYATIFKARATRSEIDRAINIGYTMLHISGTVSSVHETLHFLPLFIYTLMYRRRISEAVTLLYELDFYSEEDSDSSGKTWFYGIGLSVQLLTGYTMLSYQFCQAFSRVEGENLITFRDPNSRVHYFTMMWLWCVRTGSWEQASVWYFKTYNTRLLENEDNLLNIIVSMSVLEGLMIYLVMRVDAKNVKILQQMYIEIDLIISYLKKKKSYAPKITPRYYLFKAYYQAVRVGPNDNSVKKYLLKSKKHANKNGDIYALGFIDHTERAWQHQLPRIQRDFWRNHCDGENQIDCRDIDDEDPDLKLGYYSLPLPSSPID